MDWCDICGQDTIQCNIKASIAQQYANVTEFSTLCDVKYSCAWNSFTITQYILCVHTNVHWMQRILYVHTHARTLTWTHLKLNVNICTTSTHTHKSVVYNFGFCKITHNKLHDSAFIFKLFFFSKCFHTILTK